MAGTYKDFSSVTIHILCAEPTSEFSFGHSVIIGKVVSYSSLQVLNRSSQCPSRHTGLRHDVVFFRRGKCCMAEQILDAADINRVSDRPERGGSMPKTDAGPPESPTRSAFGVERSRR